MLQGPETFEAPKDSYAFGGKYIDVYYTLFEAPEVRGRDVHVRFSGTILFSPDDHLGLKEQWFKNGEIVFSGVQEFKQILAIPKTDKPGSYDPLVVLLVPLADVSVHALLPQRYFVGGRVTHPSEGHSQYMISRCQSVTIKGDLEFDGKLLSPNAIRYGELQVADWPYD